MIVEETGLGALMGAPANILLLAWDIMSGTIPFYSEGLESIEFREISNYAQQVQNDACQNINTLIASLRANSTSLTPEDCVQLAEYCYIYLKSCYLARSSAIASLKNVSDETHDKLESKISVEKEVNQKIAEYLSILSCAGIENNCYILGVLPGNNDELLKIDPLLTSVVDVETEFGVTSLRQLTKVIRYDSNGSYTQHNLSYNENGLLENYLIEYHSDRFENTREYRLAYDSNNRLVCCKDPEKACPDYEYRYSQDGRLTGWSMWEYDDADCESKYICEYDNLGRLVKEYTEYSEDGMDVIIHTYDETGRLTSVVSNNTFEISAGTKTTMYDDQGRIAEKVHDFSGPYGSTYRFRYSYDYAPFILIECYEEGDWIPSSLGLQDIKPEELVFFKLDKTATFEMHDGYVSKIIGDDYTYVFSYGDGMIFKTGNINVPQDTVDDMNSQARTYQDILTMYHTSISLNWTNCDGEDEYIGDPDNACYMFKHYEPNRKLEEIGFALLDINNDGQDELFISLLDMAVSGSFYDMYTICNGEIVHVVSAGERDQYNLAENSSINNSGSGSALLSSEVNYRLDGTDGTLKINQAVVYDGWRDSENPWFYATTDYFDAETYKYDYNLLEPISEEKAFTLMADFPQNIYLNLIPFSEYNLSINTEPLN
jgi:hypothetical protein